jgi:hypothetical protein
MLHPAYFISFFMFAVVASVAWSFTLYVELKERSRAQRYLQPRSRPVLQRGVTVMPPNFAAERPEGRTQDRERVG